METIHEDSFFRSTVRSKDYDILKSTPTLDHFKVRCRLVGDPKTLIDAAVTTLRNFECLKTHWVLPGESMGIKCKFRDATQRNSQQAH